MKVYMTGRSGRLGKVVEDRLRSRGDEIVDEMFADDQNPVAVNYLVFAHRYRGRDSLRAEMEANVFDVSGVIEGCRWADGDKAVVMVSSVDACDPAMNQPLSYNLSKAALNQMARYYGKALGVRVNTVSPATFTTETPDVTKEEVAEVIAFLCSPAGSGINGEDIRVTGRLRYERRVQE